MLRQQADRIAELEKQLNLHKNAHHKCVEISKEQADRIAELEKESANLEHSLKNALIFIDNAKQSEPVAWMDKYGNVCTNIQKKMYAGNITAQYNYDLNDIPLYTTPQTKPLSDEEISELSEKHLDMDWQTGVIEFARAIESKVRGQK